MLDVAQIPVDAEAVHARLGWPAKDMEELERLEAEEAEDEAAAEAEEAAEAAAAERARDGGGGGIQMPGGLGGVGLPAAPTPWAAGGGGDATGMAATVEDEPLGGLPGGMGRGLPDNGPLGVAAASKPNMGTKAKKKGSLTAPAFS